MQLIKAEVRIVMDMQAACVTGNEAVRRVGADDPDPDDAFRGRWHAVALCGRRLALAVGGWTLPDCAPMRALILC